MKRIGFLLCLVLATQAAFGQEKVRVFIADSDSWSIGGGFASGSRGGGGGAKGGARPQTVEIMKTFRDNCPVAIVTIREERADFLVLLEHEGGKGIIRKDNKVAVFNKDGDLIYANSTRSLGNSVKDACKTITEYAL
ncbi:MAG: hypothetical protein V3R60_05100 [Acidobacteriota bacterium]